MQHDQCQPPQGARSPCHPVAGQIQVRSARTAQLHRSGVTCAVSYAVRATRGALRDPPDIRASAPRTRQRVTAKPSDTRSY